MIRFSDKYVLKAEDPLVLFGEFLAMVRAVSRVLPSYHCVLALSDIDGGNVRLRGSQHHTRTTDHSGYNRLGPASLDRFLKRHPDVPVASMELSCVFINCVDTSINYMDCRMRVRPGSHEVQVSPYALKTEDAARQILEREGMNRQAPRRCPRWFLGTLFMYALRMLWPNALHVPHGDVRQRWLSPAEILIWYEAQRREVPGQKLKDIFRAWSGFLEVSEVMLHGRK